jgi:hypothetical protein
LVVVFRLRLSHPDYINRSGAKLPEISFSLVNQLRPSLPGNVGNQVLAANLKARWSGRACRCDDINRNSQKEESVQGAKEWLTAHMPSDQSYSPTRHQSAYSDLMDLSQARLARSFRKFEKEVGGLLGLELGERLEP